MQTQLRRRVIPWARHVNHQVRTRLYRAMNGQLDHARQTISMYRRTSLYPNMSVNIVLRGRKDPPLPE